MSPPQRDLVLCGIPQRDLRAGALGEGEVDQHDGADAFLALDAQGAAVELGEGARDRKTEARALVALRELRLDLLEWTSELLERLGRDADAVVLDVDVDGAGRQARAHGDAAAVRREL